MTHLPILRQHNVSHILSSGSNKLHVSGDLLNSVESEESFDLDVTVVLAGSLTHESIGGEICVATERRDG